MVCPAKKERRKLEESEEKKLEEAENIRSLVETYPDATGVFIRLGVRISNIIFAWIYKPYSNMV